MEALSVLNESLRPVILWLTFLLGLLIGSFLNVMALRLLKDESFVTPPSACPQCKAKIKPLDNIPVISYLLLGGRCRACQGPISLQYPLVELATGLLFSGLVWFFDLSWGTLLLAVLVANLIVITITDWHESLIFEINSLPLIPLGLLFHFLNLGKDFLPVGAMTPDLPLGPIVVPGHILSALLGVVLAVVFFEGLILLSKWLVGTEGFGHGDTHLMMGVGAFLGWELGLAAILLGFVFQALPAFPMLIVQWIRSKNYISLGAITAAIVFGLLPSLILRLHLPPVVTLIGALASLAVSVTALWVFMRRVRESQSFTYLPLGPALVVASLLCLFWGPHWLGRYLGG